MGFKKLMNFFYLDKEIESEDLKEFSGQYQFSELSIQKSSLSKILQSSLDSSLNFIKIDSVQEIEMDHDELIYKLTLKFLRRDGYDIGNYKIPEVKAFSS